MNIAKLPDSHSVSVNPQTNQINNKQTGKTGCHHYQLPGQPLGKCALGFHAPVHFERLFFDRRAVPILDPMRASLTPLVLDISKRPIRVVGCKFDYPSRHGILPHSILPPRRLKHDWSIGALTKIKLNEARRIAANIAKLPELLGAGSGTTQE